MKSIGAVMAAGVRSIGNDIADVVTSGELWKGVGYAVLVGVAAAAIAAAVVATGGLIVAAAPALAAYVSAIGVGLQVGGGLMAAKGVYDLGYALYAGKKIPNEAWGEMLGGALSGGAGKFLKGGFGRLKNLFGRAPKAGLRVASSAGGDILPMSKVRQVMHGEKVSDLINEGKALTWAGGKAGKEHALVTLANGERWIVSGGSGGINFQSGQIKNMFGHTHPTSAPPSAADFRILGQLNQSRQYVFHGGQMTVVRRPR